MQLQLLILETAARPEPGSELTSYFAVCLGLIALVLVAAWGFKRLFARSIAARAARRSLQVIDVLPLGGRQRLAVVRCYERTFVVGLGDKEMCLVSELEAATTEELAPAAEPLPSPADQNAFLRLLRAAAPKPPRDRRGAPPSALSPEGLLG